MTLFLVTLHVIVCLILILVILLQAGRGQGLTGPSFASGNVQSLFGTGAADFLTKATSVAAICFLFTCVILDYREAQKSKSLLNFDAQHSQMDMDSIKKALERVKNEGKTDTGEAQKTLTDTDTTKTVDAQATETEAPSESLVAAASSAALETEKKD